MEAVKKMLAKFFDSPKIVALFILLLLALAWGGATMSYGIVKNKLLTKSKREVTKMVNQYNELSASSKAVVSLLKKKDLKILALQAALGKKKTIIHKDQIAIINNLNRDIKNTKKLSAKKLAEELSKLGY